MRLGIVVTRADAAAPLVALARAALAAGWPCRCFLTDTGVLALETPQLGELARAGLRIDVCLHSWEHHGRGQAPAGFEFNMGTQLQNAVLARESERVVVL